MGRTVISLNNSWKFAKNFNEEYIDKTYNDENFELVCIPHMNEEIPYNYFDEKIYQYVSCYRKHFVVNGEYEGKRIYIDFEGAMTYAKVYINSIYLGEHKGGYTPFSFDLTDFILFDEDNVITIMVDSTEREDIPPFGNVVDYLTYGGIYREVNLRIVDEIHINNIFAKPINVLAENKALDVDVYLNNVKKNKSQIRIDLELFDSDSNLVGTTSKNIDLTDSIQEENISLSNLKEIKLWDIVFPELYIVIVSIYKNGEIIDTYETRVGFRITELTSNGFFLNGKLVKIMGLNRHQSYPYVGYAMPKRTQRKDADILKFELGLNSVRTSHYPQSKHFLDRCDEIGLLVFEEIPGWQYIGNAEWKDVACENVKEMIMRDWNHPSIFIWGVRINESNDDHDFYTKTNKISHELDDTRPTGGVRCNINGELLEDVYTMNDFVCGSDDLRSLRPQQEITGLDENVPYLITEYNGHMYPTKRFDQEERLNEHALRHYRVQNAAKLDPNKCGAIGWCAFDYNTHYQFGSGDRICYHGVMDMFRLPKFAAYTYKSQMSPQNKIVFEPVTLYARGERKDGIAPLTICTNCNKVEFFLASRKIGIFYPAYDRFPGLEHPPVIIDKVEGVWGEHWEDALFIGYLDDVQVAQRKFLKDPISSDLRVTVDDVELESGDTDCTRIVFEAVDAVGNILPFSDMVINLEIDGVGYVIGPMQFSLIGGCRATWVKTFGQKGSITIHIHTQEFESKKVSINVR